MHKIPALILRIQVPNWPLTIRNMICNARKLTNLKKSKCHPEQMLYKPRQDLSWAECSFAHLHLHRHEAELKKCHRKPGMSKEQKHFHLHLCFNSLAWKTDDWKGRVGTEESEIIAHHLFSHKKKGESWGKLKANQKDTFPHTTHKLAEAL